MNDKQKLLRHFLAALAYRTQKALRGAPPEFASFQAGKNVRTPHELISHMDQLLGYTRTLFIGGRYSAPELTDFQMTISHFHEMLEAVARHLELGPELRGVTPEMLLQGPLSDAMTHAGQLAMLRRLHGSPVPSESFIDAEIDADNLGPDQPSRVRPHED